MNAVKPPLKLSYSSITAWNKCQWLWHVRYMRRIHAPKPPALDRGSMVHAGLAAYFNGGQVSQAILDYVLSTGRNKQDEAVAKLMWEATNIVIRTIDSLRGKWESVLDHSGKPLVEFRLEDKVAGIPFEGVVDWVARNVDSGQVWLFDHKVREHLQPDEGEDYNMQMAIYQYLLRKRGLDVVGSITHQIRAAIPSMPKLNQNGSMSRADILTDWETYSATLHLHGLDPADYTDMQDKLSGKEFFRLSKTYRSEEQLDRIWKSVVIPNVVGLYLTWKHTKPSAVPPRNIHSVNCKLCAHNPLCMSELRGYDTDFLFESGMFVKEEL